MKSIKIAVLVCLLNGTAILNAQESINKITTDQYPSGIYATMDDFIMAVPSDTQTAFTIKVGSDTISHRFYDAASGDRLRKVFAVSHEGNLYFRMKDILKNMAKEDQNQLKDDGDYHLKAIDISPKYIYFEDYFTSTAAAVWGGAIASAASRRLKGLVYDQESRKFNLFKNSKDFEKYITMNHPEFLAQLPSKSADEAGTKRKPHNVDIELVRTIIFKINQEARLVN